ncbi:hypothetical protein CHARACLAT_032249 [Characodon lateralis]|uniref:Uncharacterized protein n=1 Tax=Characodon lateralis TaxID=208331 RepID=A0ABU7EYU1_9TELE|nr:hypothetical protein [Characodon lateralis]
MQVQFLAYHSSNINHTVPACTACALQSINNFFLTLRKTCCSRDVVPPLLRPEDNSPHREDTGTLTRSRTTGAGFGWTASLDLQNCNSVSLKKLFGFDFFISVNRLLVPSG